MKQSMYSYYRHIRFRLLKRWYSLLAKPFISKAIRYLDRRSRRFASLGLIILLVGLMVLSLVFPAAQVQAQIHSLGSNDLLQGKLPYSTLQLNNQNTQLSLQQGYVGSWDQSTVDGTQPVQTLMRGTTSYAYGPNDVIYHLSNNGGICYFRAFDIELQEWNILKSVPIGCGSGAHLVSDDTQYIYYFAGGSTSVFYRYNIASDSWEKLADVPSQVGGYSDATYVVKNNVGYVYLFRGASSASFLRYNVSTKAWDTLTPFPTSSTVAYGIALTWDEGDTVYAVNNRIGEFKKYTISTNSWTDISSLSYPNTHVSLVYVQGAIVAAQLRVWPDTYHGVLQSYNIASNTWSELPRPPIGSTNYDYTPPAVYDGSRYIYVQYGTEIYPDMYRYDTQTQSWNSASLFQQDNDDTRWHQGMIFDGTQSVYYAGGVGSGSVDRIYKYDLVTKETTQIGSQINTASGWKGVYKSGVLYMLPWSGNTTFQKYDIATNAWTPLADLPYATNWGLDIVDGNDGYLYAVTGARNEFWRYSIATNAWTQLANIPLRPYAGGGLTRIGTTIYASTGGSYTHFYRYNMTTNTWSQITNFIPNGKIDHGGFISSDGSRYVYIGAGTRTDPGNRRLYRLDTTNDSWQRLADLPAPTNVNASAFYDSTSSKLYVAQAWNSSRLWSWSPSAANYVTSGTWYSKTIPLTQVQSWQPLQMTTGGTGTTTVYTRTSSNGRLWTDWQAVTGTTINSPVNKYVQLKITLTGNGSTTPTVSDINIQYDQEAVAPNLPSQFNAYNKSGGSTQLTSGQTYEYQHPYFTWSGASDGVNGSGIDGYYVYFGTDSNADPATEGNYQSDSTYTVTSPMTAGDVYYVRIKAKDKLGNISAGATYFSYRYWYISPPGSQVMTSDSDFNGGINTHVAISNNSMKLRNIAGGAWGTGPTDALPDTPYGSTEVIVGDYMYMMRGSTTATMWRYDLLNKAWQTMADAPGTFTTGSSMTYDGSRYIYAIAGGNTNNFYKYDTDNDSWSTLINLPSSAQLGSDITYIGNGKIAMIFTGGREFYVFDIAGNTFDTRQSYPSTIGYGGSGIWYNGDDSIYVNMGGDTLWAYADNSRVVLAEYSLSNDTWRSLSQPPISSFYSQNNLVSDGHGGLYMVSTDGNQSIGKNQMAFRYDIASDTWDEAAGLNAQVMYGSLVSDNDRYIYIIPSDSGQSRQLIRYDTWDKTYTPATQNIDKWERLRRDWPYNAWTWVAGNATTATYDGSKYIYAIGADEGGFSRFVRFDPVSGDTDYLSPPYYVNLGGSLAYLDGKVYYMRGGGSRELISYDVATQMWSRMSDIPVATHRAGASALQVVGSNIYVVGGYNNTNFYMYTPDSGAGTWTQRANVPSNVYYGSATYDSANGYIYLLAGNSTSNFYRYSIASNTWSAMASLPTASAYGNAMTLHNGKIYAALGALTTTTYVYDIASNSWTSGTLAPAPFTHGSIFIPIDSTHAFAISGDNSADIWRFNYPSSTTAYEGSATHVSQTFTTPGIFDYAGVTAQIDTPNNTRVEFFTRTSADGNTWDDWSRTSDTKKYNGQITTKVTSTPRLYLQIKVVMESMDNLYTPTVDSYALNYYFDVDPPTNPSVVHVYKTVAKVDELTSNVWYNNPTPVFDWPNPGEPGGATDGPLGSNLAGYWVYLGTDPTASPRTAGQFVTDSQYTPTLQTSGTYYLRIQAQDVTGNVDGSVYAPFVYKFDKDPPTTPSFITVTPGGYTTTNNFTFDWPAAFDANSGVASYCYHTGANSGPFATETCQSGRNLTDLPIAYKTGTNVFYLRTLDIAGNYSSSYTTVSYYYSTDPPSPPTNLRAIPPSSSQNLFAFAWDLPSLYSGDPDQLSYCYSVNELPSAVNSTCTGDRFISAFKAATRQGTNILYMVTKDEANNVNWNDYGTANFIANTVSPGIPLNLVVTDTSDRVSERWSLTQTWDKPTFEGNGISDYVIERSPDGHAFTEIGNTSTTAFVDLDVEPGDTYYYRVIAADNVDNRGGPSGTVSATPEGSFTSPPTIVVSPDAKASFDQATISWVTNREATSFVYYGTNPSDLKQSKGSLDLVNDHSVTITGLDPSSTYYYRVQSFDNVRSYNLADAYSQLLYFKTSEAARIFNVGSDSTTLSSTVIDWQTSVPTQTRIEYGTSTSYGLNATDDDENYSSDHTFKLRNLASGTTYHYRIVATSAFGSTIRSDDYTFTTIARPIIRNVRFNPLQNEPTTSVKVSWTTNVPTTSTVRYQGSGVALESSKSALKTSHEVTLRGLASSTDYVINIEGRDQYGNLTTSEQQRWRSGYDTRAPKISDISLSMTTTEGTANTRAQLIVSWKTDEPSASQVAYGKLSKGKLDKLTPLDTEPTTNHVVIVSNLDLADIYKVQIISRDISGNKSYSTPTLVVTPDRETSVLDSVITLMQKLFGF